jgi:hypothetical protein
MAGHYPEVAGIILLLIFAATMFYHGTMIMRQHHGYSQRYIKRDMENMRRRVEELLKENTED